MSSPAVSPVRPAAELDAKSTFRPEVVALDQRDIVPLPRRSSRLAKSSSPSKSSQPLNATLSNPIPESPSSEPGSPVPASSPDPQTSLPASASSRTLETSPPASPSSHKRKRDDNSPKMLNKNEVDILELPTRYIVCKIARSCGHLVHPEHKSYESSTCPRCTMESQVKDLRALQTRFKERDGIFSSKEKNRTTHRLLLAGWVSNAQRRRAMNNGEDPGAGSWRRAKTTLVNYVQRLEEMAIKEKTWAENRMLEFGEENMPEWNKYSAVSALQYYRKFEDDIQYVEGDPAAKRCTPEDIQGEPIAKKRRLSGPSMNHNVTFQETVSVSPFHDINHHKRAARQKQRSNLWHKVLAKVRTTKPEPQGSIQPLNDEPRRKKVRFYRVGPGYEAGGAWGSPAGFVKADTSWESTHYTKQEEAAEEEEEEDDEQPPAPSVNGACAVVSGVGGAVLALKVYLRSG